MPEQIHAEHGQAGQLEDAEHAHVRDAGGDQDRIYRQAGGAAHERRDQDGDQPVLGAFDGAGGHDARNGAGKGTEHGNETLAVQADLAHQPVHEKGGPGHVAGVLQKPDEEEQQQDLRQENHHGSHARDDAVHEQAVQVPGRQSAADEVAEPVHRRLERLHGDGAKVKML